MKYQVTWHETYTLTAAFEADSEAEAKEKAGFATDGMLTERFEDTYENASCVLETSAIELEVIEKD